MKQSLKEHIRLFFTTNFTQLLVYLILFFIFRPYDRGIVYSAVWHMLFTLVILMGIFNAHHTYHVKIAAIIFGVPSVLFSWAAAAFEHPTLIMLYLFFSAVYIIIILCSIIKQSVVSHVVTAETLRAVVVVYFLIGFAFAYLFYLVELLMPGSFHLLYDDSSLFSHNKYLSEMLYFSFVTVLSIGYGDITARADVAQTFAILEGIIGKFYVALLVSRLVSVYTTLAQKEEIVKSQSKRILKPVPTPSGASKIE